MKIETRRPGRGIQRVRVISQLNPLPNQAREAEKNVLPPLAAAVTTEVTAKIDVGFGNQLFIRGQGDSLTWEKGIPMDCKDASTWVWSTCRAKDTLQFKFLLNDQVWAQGQDMVVQAGTRLEIVPQF